MIEDAVMKQVREAKEAFAASHGYDLRRMHAALREMDAASGVPTVRLEPRKPEVQPPIAPAVTQPAMTPASTMMPSV